MNAFTAALTAIANYFGWAKDRSNAAQAADVKARAQQQDEANARAKENAAVRKQDTKKIQEGLGE